MNKIFKVIWSHAQQAWVAVSELTKSHSKNTACVDKRISSDSSFEQKSGFQLNLLTKSVLVGLFALAFSVDSFAYEADGGDDRGGRNWRNENIAIGQGSSSGTWNSVAIGRNAQWVLGLNRRKPDVTDGEGQDSIIIGANSRAAQNSTVVGSGAEGKALSATAFGRLAKASGEFSIAIGSGEDTASSTITTGHEAIAMGRGARASGQGSVVLGYEASSTENAQGSFAALYQAQTTGNGAIALGRYSKGYNRHAVAIGGGAEARGLRSIAMGAATDDGNGHSPTGSLANGEDSIAIGVSSKAANQQGIALGREANAGNTQSMALGASSSASAAQAIALGGNTIASGYGAIAIGGDDLDGTPYQNTLTRYQGSTASGKASVVLGAKSTASADGAVALGAVSRATKANGVAIGTESLTTKDAGQQGWRQDTTAYAGLAATGTTRVSNRAAVAIGNDTTITRQLTGLAAGTADTDAVNVAQLKALTLGLKGNTGEGHTTLSNETLEIVGAGGVTTAVDQTGGKTKITITGSNTGGTASTTTYKADGGLSSGNLDTKDTGYVANSANNEVSILTTQEWTDKSDSNAKYVGTNVQTLRQANGTFHIGIKENPMFASVQYGSSTGPKITNDGNDLKITGSNGTSAVKITNVADGTADNDAVNVSQLNAKVGTINYKADVTGGNADTGVTKNSSDRYNYHLLTNNHWTTGSDKFVGDNIETYRTDNGVLIGIKEKPTFKKITIASDGDGIDMGNKPITNLAAGSANNDAVNVSQLNPVKSETENIYFHTNINSNDQQAGDSTTNKGKITDKAGATGAYSLTGGYKAVASGGYSVAVGNESKALGADSVAVGNNAKASGTNSVAVGAHLEAGPYSAALGYGAKALGTGSVAIGENAKTVSGQNGVDRATALGNNASATVTGGVALGYASVANTAGNIDGAKQAHSVTTDSTVENGFKSTQAANGNNIGAVSVGSSSIKRQITNVAAGTALTDAVNVAQLQSLAMKIEGNTGNSTSEKVGIWDGSLKVKGATDSRISTTASGDTITINLDKDNLKNDLAGQLTLKAEKIDNGTVNEGTGSTWKSSENKTISILSSQQWGADGTANRYTGDNIEVYRSGETVHIGFKQNPTFGNITASSLAVTNGPTINSSGINMNNKPITNLTAGTNPNDAVNVSQLTPVKTETESIYFHTNTGEAGQGTGNSDTNKGKITDKAGATATGAITAGVNTKATSINAIAVGKNTNAAGYGAVAIGSNEVGNDQETGLTNQSSIYSRVGYHESGEVKDLGSASTQVTEADKFGATAIGLRTRAKGNVATAIGAYSNAIGGGSFAAGFGAAGVGNDSIAMGTLAVAKDNYSIASGFKAKAVGSSAVAIGANSKVTKAGGIALGSRSEATVEGGQTGAKQTYSAYTPAATATGAFTSTTTVGNDSIGAVSVGKADGSLTRQIVGVAAGTQDTDATNVAQLKSLTMKIEGNTGNSTNEKVGIWDGTLKVKGSGAVKTTASGDTITISLDQNQLPTGSGVVSANTYFHTNTGVDSQGEGDANTNLGKIEEKAGATGKYAVTAGVNTKATANSAIAIGSGLLSNPHGKNILRAKYDSDKKEIVAGATVVPDATETISSGDMSVAIGGLAKAAGDVSTALGAYSHALGNEAVALGALSAATGAAAISIGSLSAANGVDAVAIGWGAKARGNFSAALGLNAKALNQNAIAIGNGATAGIEKDTTNISTVAIGDGAIASHKETIAIGKGAKATAEKAISIGTGNIVSGNNSGAFGDPSIVKGTNSYSFGNNNAIGEGNDNVIVVGGQNEVGATPTRDDKGVINTTGAFNETSDANRTFVMGYKTKVATTAATNDSVIIGNENTANNNDVFVLGSKVTTTVGDSVYLGKESAATKDTGNTTGGATGAVTDATVNKITYSGFAGTTPVGVITVGSAGKERRIQNVAAGKISATSTDAINGSQLYLTNNVIGNIADSLAGAGDNDILGGNAALTTSGADAGKITMSNIGNTNKNNIHDAIIAAKTTVIKGKNISSVNETTKDDGSKQYTIDAYKTTVAVADGDTLTTVTGGEPDAQNVLAYKVGVKKGAFGTTTNGTVVSGTAAGNSTGVATVEDVVSAVNAGYWTANVNGANSQNVKFGDSVNFVSGKGTTARKATDGITYDVNLTSSDQTVTITPPTENGAVDIKVNTANLPKTVVATGKNTTVTPSTTGNTTTYTVDAIDTVVSAKNNKVEVSGGTIDENTKTRTYTVGLSSATEATLNKVETQGITFTGDSGSTSAKKLGESLAVNGKANEITVTASADKLEIGLAEKVKTDIAAKMTSFNVKANSEANGEAVGNGDTVAFIEGKNISVSRTGKDFTIKTKDDVAFTNVTTNTLTAGPVVINKDTGINAGNKAITNVAAPTNDNDAANKKYVDDSRTTITAGTNVVSVNEQTTSGRKTYRIDVKDTTAVVTASNGLEITSTTTNADPATNKEVVTYNVGAKVDDVTIKVNQEGKLYATATSPETTTLTTGTSGKVDAPDTANENKLVTAKEIAETINEVSWTVTSDNSGTGTKSGTKADEKVKAGDKVTLKAGDNLDINQAGKDFTFSLKNNINLTNSGSIIFGDNGTKLDNTGLTTANNGPKVLSTGIDAGNKAITNVAAPTNNTDAANKQYVDDSRTTITAGTNVVSVNEQEVSGRKTYRIDVKDTTAVVTASNGLEITSTTTNTEAGTNKEVTTYNVAAKVDDVTIKVDQDGKLYATATSPETTTLTTGTSGKVDAPDTANENKLVTAKEIAETINEVSWTVTSDVTGSGNQSGNKTDEKVKAGDKVTLKAGDNLDINQAGKDFTFSLKNNINLTNSGSIIFGNNGTKLDNTGLTTANNGPKVLSTGIDAGNKAITNVAAPTNNTDAANKQYVDDTNTKVAAGTGITVGEPTTDSNGAKTYTVAVDKGTFNETVNNGALNTPTKNGVATVEDVVSAVNKGYWIAKSGNTTKNVKFGDTVTFVDGTATTASMTADGNVQYDVKYDNNTITTTNDGKLQVNTDALPKTTFKVQANSEATQDITHGDTLIFKDGNNISVSRTGKEFTIGTSMTPTFNDVTINNAPTEGNHAVNKTYADSLGWKTNVTGANDTGNKTEAKITNNEVVNFAGGTNVTIDRAVTTTDGVDTVTYTINATAQEIPAAETTTLTVNETATGDKTAGTVSTTEGNKLVKADTVVNAINNTFWSATTGKEGSGTQATGSENKTANVKAGNTVTFKAGDNLVIKQDGTDSRDFTYSVNPELKGITSIANGTNDTKDDGAKITLSSDPNNKTVDVNDSKITNVASGLGDTKLSEATGDVLKNAVNVGDLQKARVEVAAGNNVSVKETTETDGHTKYTVHADKSVVTTGTGLTLTTTPVTNDTTGETTTTYNVSLATTTLKDETSENNATPNVADGKIDAPATDDANKVVTASGVADAINKSGFTLKSSADGGTKATSTPDEIINPGDVVDMAAGKNMVVKQAASGKITYSTADDVNFTSVQFGDNGPKISKDDSGNIKISGNDGTTPVKITNVANGTDDNDAVNVSQLNAKVATAVEKVKHDTTDTDNIATVSPTGEQYGKPGTEYVVKVSKTAVKNAAKEAIDVKGTGAITVNTTDENGVETHTVSYNGTEAAKTTPLSYKANNGTADAGTAKTVMLDKGLDFTNTANITASIEDNGVVKHTLNSELKGITSIANGNDTDKSNGAKITLAGDKKEVSVNDSKITNVADGSVADASKDAVTGSQLYNYVKVETAGTGEGATSTTNVATKDGSVTFKDGTNTSVKLEDGKISYSTKVDGSTITVNDKGELVATAPATTDLTVSDGAGENAVPAGKVVEPTQENENKLVTAKEIAATINEASWTVTSDNTGTGTKSGTKADEKVKAGDKVTLKAGDNLDINQAGKDFTFSLKKDIDLTDAGSITFGTNGPTLNNTGLTIGTNGPSITTSGINAGNQVITNVAAPTAGDHAVNKTYADALGWKIGKVGETNEVGKVINDNRVNFEGTNAATVNVTKEADGTYKVSIDVATVNLPESTKMEAGKNTTVEGNGSTATPFKVNVEGDLTGISSIANGNDDAKSNGAKISLSGTGDKTVTLNDAKLTGLANGNVADASKDAVTGSQLKDLADEIGVSVNTDNTTFKTPEFTKLKTDKNTNVDTKEAKNVVNALEETRVKVNEGLKFKGEEAGETKVITKQLGETLEIVSGDITTGDHKGENIAVESSGTQIVVGMKDALTNIKSVSNGVDGTGTKITLADTKKEVSVNDAKITNVANGAVEDNSKDAVTGDQLHNFIKVDGNAVQSNGSVTFAAGDNATVTASNGTITVGVDKGSLTTTLTNSDTGTVNTPANGDENKFATASSVANVINNTFWNATSDVEGTGTRATGNTASTANVKAGNTVTFKAGDNLVIKQDGTDSRDFTYSLNPELTKLTSAEFKTTGGTESTTLTTNGITITPTAPAEGKTPVSLTKDGLDNGGNTITNVAAPVNNTDAANKKYVDDGRTAVTNGNNITVTPATDNTTGKTTYTVAVNEGTFNGVNNNGALNTPTKEGVATVEDVVEAVNKGYWTANVNGTTEVAKVKFGDSLNFVNGKGTTARKTDAGGITYDVNLKSSDSTVTITDNTDGSVDLKVNVANLPTTKMANGTNTTVEGSGTTNDPFKVNVNTTTLTAEKTTPTDGTEAKETGKVATPADGDKDKLVTAETVANAINKAGFTLKSSADGGTKDTGSTEDEIINPGDVVDMAAGKNMVVKQAANGKITYSTADDVKFTSVQFGDNGPKITNNNGDLNLGKGTNGTDPVKITNVATPTADNDAANKKYVDDSRTVVKAGKNVTVDKNTSVTTHNEYTVNAEKTTVSAVKTPGENGGEATANKYLVVTPGAKDANNVTDYSIDLTQEAKDKIAKVDSKITFAGNSGSVEKGLGETLNVKGVSTVADNANTNNITVNGGANGLEIKLAEDVNLGENGSVVTGKTTVDNSGVTITKPNDATADKSDVKLTATGLDNGGNKVINVAKGDITDTSKDAVNGSQLKDLAGKVGLEVNTDNNTFKQPQFTSIKTTATDTAAKADKSIVSAVEDTITAVNKGLKFKGEETTDKTITKQLGETLEIVSGDITTGDHKGENIAVESNGTQIVVGMKDALTNIKSVSNGADGTGTKITLADTKKEVSVNDAKITNVANGAVEDNSKDAVTGDQLFDYVNVNGTSATKTTGDKKGTVNFVDGTGTTLTKDTDGNVKIDVNTAALTTTLSNNATDGKVNTPADEDKAKLVTAETVANAINNSGWVVGSDTATGKADKLVKTGEKVNLEVGDNLLLKQDDKKFTYSLNPVLTNLTSAQFKEGAKETNVTSTGLTTTDGTYTTTVGPKSITVGDTTSSTDKPVTITSGDNGGTISNLDGNLNGAKNNTQAPTTVGTAPTDTAINNNAATVGDVLNAGWNLQGNGEAKDFVKPYDTVNFANGAGTIVDVTTDANGKVSTVKVNVDKGTLDVKDGKLVGVDTAALDKAVTDAEAKVKEAKDAQNQLDPTASEEAKKEVADKVAEAEKALTDAKAAKETALNKVATVENVADAINKSGFTLKSSATADGAKDATSTADELINPGEVVEMVAGKNMTVKQEANGKITYATKDDVEFNTVKVGTAGTGTDTKQQVTLKTENAKPATNNPDASKPTTALDIKSTDGKPTQITGVGSTLNTTTVNTNPDGKADTPVVESKLVNLAEDGVNPNSVATVGDLQNMGWVISASENGYVDTVKNANKVDLKGEKGISVTGKTTADGTREIVVSIKEGEVVKSNEGTVTVTKPNGEKETIDVVKVTTEDGNTAYYKKDDIDPTTGKPKENTTALDNNIVGENGKNVENKGSNFVTGNTVADALQKSGFTVGKQADTAGVTFDNQDEKVNPNDELRFADGQGTRVSTATVKRIDPNGEVSTKTIVKVDVDAGQIGFEKVGEGDAAKETGKVIDENVAKVEQAIKDAEKAVADATKAKETAGTDEQKQKAEEELKAAEEKLAQAKADKAKLPNKVATVQNVVEAINKSGFTLKADKTDGENLTTDTTLKASGELINPSDVVTMQAGKNMTVKQEASGKITYATKDDVEFNTVKVGTAGTGTDTKQQVTLKTENAKPATNNPDASKPTTVLDIKSTDGKPTQITGVGSTLNTTTVNTNPDGKADTPVVENKLVNLAEDGVNPNSAATVGDLQNMGWVISATGNDYTDTVKNANEVKLKGKDGIKVEGSTTGNVREITISLEKGEVVKSNEFVVTKEDGTTVEAVKVDDKYYAKTDIDPTTGEPKAGTTPLTPKKDADNKDIVENKGSNFVTGNTVADALQKSGFTVGKSDGSEVSDFNNKDEKINPNDNLKFADGKGTEVSLGTVKKLDADGTVSTTTVVKVDVDQGKITVDAQGKAKGDEALFNAKEALNSAEKSLVELKAKPNATAEDLVKASKAVIDAQAAVEKAIAESNNPEKAKAELALKEAEANLNTLREDPNTKVEDLLKAAENVVTAKEAVTKAENIANNKVATVENVVDAINKSGFTLKTSETDGGKKLSGSDELINPGETVEMVAGKNMTVTQNGNGQIVYATANDVSFNKVSAGTIMATDKIGIQGGPSLSIDGIDAGGKRITNVANGVAPTDAVNVSQLKGLQNNINYVNYKVDKLDRRVRGIGASSAAAAALPQVYIPGKSMIAASAGGYDGASALAIGYSRSSDNGKLILKIQGTTNSQGDVSGGAGVGYQW